MRQRGTRVYSGDNSQEKGHTDIEGRKSKLIGEVILIILEEPTGGLLYLNTGESTQVQLGFLRLKAV